MKIRHKITLLVALPLTAVFAFAALAVVTTGGEAVSADQLRKMVVINREISDLVSTLQTERSAAVQTLTGDDDDDKALDAFLNAVHRTDKAIEGYDAARREAGDLPGTVETLLDEADENLKKLESTRNKVTGGTQTSAAVAFAYRIPIADLLDYRESVPQAGGASSEVGDMIRASTQLLQSGEHQSLEDASVLRAIDKGSLSELHYAQIVESASASEESRLAFSDLADQEWRGLLESSRQGEDMIEAQALEYQVAGTSPGEEPDIDRSEWVDRIDYLADKRQELQKRIDKDVVTEVSQVRADQLWWTGAQMIVVFVVVVLMVLLALRLGNPVVRGLRRLSTAARYVASEGLPKAVAQLDDHEELGDHTPEEFAKTVDPPIEIRGHDELADVGRAFNEVHEEAVRVAAAQALLRLHIAAMFVRLARRGHSLTGQLTSVLDEAERNEEDPQRLERLFALDHLVTLFGRSNDSLLVLGGAASSKVRRSSESFRDVLTAAQGQIEQYTRVNVTHADTDMDIEAGAVDDLVKVLAELLDNATQYSQRQVEMSGWMLSDRLVIQITDDGIGMNPDTLDKLNARLTSKAALDLESVQTMGLTVVGHLAARYDLSVSLRATVDGGTLAEVTVPPNLLVRRSESKVERPIPEAEPKRPTLFDKTKKSENRQRHAQAWRKRFGGETYSEPAPEHEPTPTPTPAPAAAPAEAPAATNDESLGAMLLPIVHFDTAPRPRAERGYNTGEQPVVAAPTQATQKRPRLFQPESAPESRAEAPRGWESAQAAAETAANAHTGSHGLPKREPMAQLVPGAAEPPSEETPHVMRNPETVSATYVAFARGRAGDRIEDVATDSARGAR